jgi:hypothetical protein
MAIVHWGDVHMAGKKGRPVLHKHTTCGHHFDPVQVCSVCAETLSPREIVIEPGPGAGAAPAVPGKDAQANTTTAKTPLRKPART